jgi:hypothetical protein
MPPKKRVPHANETPLKHTQPGHGAVEKAKDSMWTPASGSAPTSSQPLLTVSAAAGKPKYKASTTSLMTIGRGGGGAKKKKAPDAAS